MERRKPNYDEILRERAERLGTTPETARNQAPPEPQFLRGAEEKPGGTRAVLGDDLRRLRESTYPGPECLEPHEIELYLDKQLGSERLRHLDECTACHALANSCQPSSERLEEFLEEVRALSIKVVAKPDAPAGLQNLVAMLAR